MQVNNVNSTNFKAVKYRYHSVVETWYNVRIKQNGSRAISKVSNIIKQQQNNPFHIILDYAGNDKSVKEFVRVNGKEFVKRRFESIEKLLKRAASYSDKLNKSSKEKPLELDGLKDFNIKV